MSLLAFEIVDAYISRGWCSLKIVRKLTICNRPHRLLINVAKAGGLGGGAGLGGGSMDHRGDASLITQLCPACTLRMYRTNHDKLLATYRERRKL
jgi:hypothetical protein